MTTITRRREAEIEMLDASKEASEIYARVGACGKLDRAMERFNRALVAARRERGDGLMPRRWSVGEFHAELERHTAAADSVSHLARRPVSRECNEFITQSLLFAEMFFERAEAAFNDDLGWNRQWNVSNLVYPAHLLKGCRHYEFFYGVYAHDTANVGDAAYQAYRSLKEIFKHYADRVAAGALAHAIAGNEAEAYITRHAFNESVARYARAHVAAETAPRNEYGHCARPLGDEYDAAKDALSML
jgi:hypothetical protein